MNFTKKNQSWTAGPISIATNPSHIYIYIYIFLSFGYWFNHLADCHNTQKDQPNILLQGSLGSTTT